MHSYTVDVLLHHIKKGASTQLSIVCLPKYIAGKEGGEVHTGDYVTIIVMRTPYWYLARIPDFVGQYLCG